MELDIDIPDSWQKRRIRDVGEIVTGRTPSTKREDFYGGDYNLISPADLDNGKYVVTAHKRLTEIGFMECRALPKDSVLVGCIGNVGKLGMVSDERSATNQQLNAVICDKSHDSHFIYYCLHGNRTRLEQAADKTTLPILNKTNFENFEIAIPPLAEQRKIAGVLGLVQRALEQQERLIALTTELKKALLHQLFTQGLRGEPQKQTEIGPVPQSWEVVRLQNVCSLLSGGTPSKQKPEFWSGSIPWVSPKDMKKPRLSDVVDHISEAALEDGSSLAPAGAVFVVIRGMILAKDVPVALAEVPMAFNQDIKAIIPGPRIQPSFLLYALVAFKQHLFQKVGRSAHGTMTLMSSELAQFTIPLPDKSTQQKVAEAIETIERKHEQHQRKHGALTTLFRTLLHQLMTAQIRVHDLDLSDLDQEGKAEMLCGST